MNPTKKTIQIAVRSLVEYVCRSGSLGGGDFVSANRALEGTYAHRKIQKSRPAEYQAEVPITYRLETTYFYLEISGRIDGVYHTPAQVLLEEIKTTTGNPEMLIASENPVHWGQLKTYAYFYALEHTLNELDAQVVYYQLDTGVIRESRKHFTLPELTEFFQDLLARYLVWANMLEAWYQVRDPSIRALEFPFPDYRAGQRLMAVEVYRTIKQHGQLLVQAPTGIGKTMAALFPAIKAIGEGQTEKIFYLTARTTGQIAAEQALNHLRGKGLRLKSITITAKEKVCANPHICCTPEECPYAWGYFDRIGGALQAAFQTEAFTRDTLAQFAQQHTVCPFEFALDLSLWADCIICDYNYAFDPRIYLKRFFLEPTGMYTFLVDEAHNLIDRAREMFSAALQKQTFLDLRRTIKQELPELYKITGKINTWLRQAQKRGSAEATPFAEHVSPEELLPLLRDFVDEAEAWLVLNLKTPFRAELLDRFFEVNWFLTVAGWYDERYATCFDPQDRDLRLNLFCLDPSKHLEEALTRCQAVIFFSATLTPAAYFQQMFGCQESSRTRLLPSPFPPEHLCLLIANRISTLYKHRTNTVPAVAQMILAAVTAKPGNYLAFFPSYQYMRMVADVIVSDRPDLATLVQTPDMSETDRAGFLARFAAENQHSLLGFAVMGGIFGEGIDLVGDRLTGAIIVGVGLPAICLERDLIRDYFTQVNGAGFEFAYLYPGLTRVLQAAGRVIRSETDRGLVLLIDTRFAMQRYLTLFPHEWQPERIKDTHHLQEVLHQFWANRLEVRLKN